MLSHREAPTQRSIYTEELLHTEPLNLHTEKFTHSKLLHRVREAFIQFYSQKAFTQKSICTEKLLHTAKFYTQKLYTQPAFTQRSPFTEKHLQREAFTQRRLYTQQAFKLRTSADQSLSQPLCSQSNTIYDVQLLKTIVLLTPPRLQATLTQPLLFDLQRLSCKTQQNYAQRRQKLQLQNRDLDAKAKKTILKHFSKDKKNFTRKITSTKVEKICWQVTIAALMQPLQDDLRCPATVQLQNKIVLRTQLRLQATLTQPLQCDLHKDWAAKHNRTSRNGVKNCSSKTRSRCQSKKNDFEALF